MSPPPDSFLDISIIHKTYKCYLFLYTVIARFPKKDRFTIGIKCENILLEILDLLFTANAAYKNSRLELLATCDTRLKVLKTCLRLAFDIKAIQQKEYLTLQTLLQEIGKMLGGWIRQTQ